MLEFNSNLFQFFSSFSNLPFLGLIADAPIFFIPLFLAGFWIYYTFSHSGRDKRRELLHIFYACIVGIIGSYIIKQFVDIERPDSYIQQTGDLIMSTIPAQSFPSDHATVSFAFTMSLFFTGFKKIGYMFLPFVIIMNLARIGIGVHWPLDILAGAILGISSSMFYFLYLNSGKVVKKIDSIIIDIMKFMKLY